MKIGSVISDIDRRIKSAGCRCEARDDHPILHIVFCSPIMGPPGHAAGRSHCKAIRWPRWEDVAPYRAAILMTIVSTAHRHHLDVWRYLKDVLDRLLQGDRDLDALRADRRAQAHPEALRPHRVEEARYRADAKADRRTHRREAEQGRSHAKE